MEKMKRESARKEVKAYHGDNAAFRARVGGGERMRSNFVAGKVAGNAAADERREKIGGKRCFKRRGAERSGGSVSWFGVSWRR